MLNSNLGSLKFKVIQIHSIQTDGGGRINLSEYISLNTLLCSVVVLSDITYYASQLYIYQATSPYITIFSDQGLSTANIGVGLRIVCAEF